MRLLLGFTYQQADAYAREHGWRRYSRRVFIAAGDERIVHVVGDHDEDAERLHGIEVADDGGIIWGPGKIAPYVYETALSRARL